MEPLKTYENFPFWIVVITNLFSLSIYCLGFFVMLNVYWIVAVLYLLFALFLEFRVVKNHCIDCFYYGKTCGFGKGRISSLFFKKGDQSRFCSMNITWKDMIPDFLVPLIPVITGIVLLIIKFNYLILIAIIILLILTTIGNSFIRGSLTCKYCKQREVGCPADKLFNTK